MSAETVKTMTREELIERCEQAIVQVGNWENRDSPEAQRQVGECWALLKGGCPYRIVEETEFRLPVIWVAIVHPTYDSFEYDAAHSESRFYLPLAERISPDGDWY